MSAWNNGCPISMATISFFPVRLRSLLRSMNLRTILVTTAILALRYGSPIVALEHLDHSEKQKRAELSKLIGDVASRGKGLAEEATRLWIKFGLNTLGLEKICVSTLWTQLSNIKFNERVGFRVEGVLRNEELIDDLRCACTFAPSDVLHYCVVRQFTSLTINQPALRPISRLYRPR